jgi:putative ABC transport system permease protein
MFNSALFRLTRRHLNGRLFQSLLFVIGVAVGVAVGIAVDMANISASRAFDLSVSSITGDTTHQIVGSSNGVPTDLYRQLRIDLGLRTAAPVVESYVYGVTLENRALRLLGVDPFAETPFRSYLSPSNIQAGDNKPSEALYAFLAEPDTVLLSDTLASQYNLKPGDTITLQTRTARRVDAKVVGLLYPDNNLSREALDNLLLADIATAQEITGQPGILSRIDLILPDDYDLARITAILPPGVTLTTPSETNAALSQMTDAFELNLQALSLLALLVGIFLIYNTVTFSVVQRRPIIGILRSLGTTRRQIFALILTETMILGLIGTLLGLALGIVLGQGVIRLVAQSINDLYFKVEVESITIDPVVLLKGTVIGLLASLIAGIIPSIEATRTPPAGVLRRSDFEQRTLKLLPIITLGAIILTVSGYVLLQLQTKSIVIGLLALFLILIGCALLTPLALIFTMRLASPVTDKIFGVLGRMAPRAVIRSLSRTSVAVAALTLAVSVIVGVSLMISSFRNTISGWLDNSLGSDIYISSRSMGPSRIVADIDPSLVNTLAGVEGVQQVTTIRTADTLAPDHPDFPPAHLNAVSGDKIRRIYKFLWNDAPDDDYWSALKVGNIAVSEAFAFRRGITPDNNKLTLLTDRGEHTFTIIGVYYDYTTDQGAVLLHDTIYRQFFDDPYVTSIMLDLDPGADPNGIIDQLETKTLVGQNLDVQSSRALRDSVFEVFDRTFSITVALRLLATIVAFIGILSALMALQLEHTRQYGIMRANGMTPRQLRSFTFIQTGLMGTAAGLMAAPVGLILAVVLIYVINVRSFGWRLDLVLGLREFVLAFAVALIAALAAGIYPAWRLSKLVAVEALRSE